MGWMALYSGPLRSNTAHMNSELHFEVQHDSKDRPPYRVRVFDEKERLMAFRRFWTRVEAEDWGQQWLRPSTAEAPLPRS